MFQYLQNKDGSLTVVIHRCNEFDDHEDLKCDGDITVGDIPAAGYLDRAHTKTLLDLANSRLAQLQDALSALRVIRTWASFEDGSSLIPEHVINLVDQVLNRNIG